jgi:predicted amino acid dehydrogenase
MEAAPRRGRVRVAKAAATFRVGQHVRTSKEKLRFTKAAEQNFSTEIFWVAKVIERRPRVYELEDLNGTHINGQFYREELTPLRITDRSAYKIDKILDKRVRRGILEYLVR